MFTYLRHHQNVGSGVSQCMFHPVLGAKSKTVSTNDSY